MGFSNLNSVFNIEIFVAHLHGDNVDKIPALGDIKGIYIRIQLVSDSIPVITSAIILEWDSVTLLCGGLLRIRWPISRRLCPLSVSNKYGGSMPSGKEHARSA